jgi:hypothetical protein
MLLNLSLIFKNEFTTNQYLVFVAYVNSPRLFHTSTYVPEIDSVLVIGGLSGVSGGNGVRIVEKYTSINNMMVLTYTCQMSYDRAYHTANYMSVLDQIVVVGGSSNILNEEFNTATLFDPISGVMRDIQALEARNNPISAVSTLSDKLVVTGGYSINGPTFKSSGDVFDGFKFTPTENSMINRTIYHTVTYLPTIDQMLIAGGDQNVPGTSTYVSLNTLELYDVALNKFEFLSNVHMLVTRSGHTATYIPEPFNKVLITGGTDTTNLDPGTAYTYEVFDVSTLEFTQWGNMTYILTLGHTATLLNDQKTVLFSSGVDFVNDILSPCQLFNMETMTISIIDCLETPRILHTATFIESTGQVFFCYGFDSITGVFMNDCELYTP